MALVSSVEAPAGISSAIKRASKATGTDFRYLLTTAARESNFKPNAKAKTSSAAGLFQFIENTWLKTVKEEGGRFGLEKYSPHIYRTESGRYYVPDREMRSEILKLRHDANISAMMAGAFTQQNAEFVESKLGREATKGELYIAHFLGAGGATKLISTAEETPSARADKIFPKAAQANRGIFYSHGRPRSVGQVYNLLVSDHSRLEALTMAGASPVQTDAAKTLPVSATAAQATSGNSVDTGPSDTGHATQSLASITEEDKIQKAVAPIAQTRVAALDNSALAMRQTTMNDAGLGSIGPWQTIVHRSGEATAPKPMLMAPAEKNARQPILLSKAEWPIVIHTSPARSIKAPAPQPAEVVKVKSATVAPRSARAVSPIKISSSSFDLLQSDNWSRMLYGGG